MQPTLTPTTHRRYKWVITYTDPTKVTAGNRPVRRYHYFTDKAEAEKKLREINKAVLVGGVHALELTPAARADFLTARALLDADFPGVSIADVARAWLNMQGRGPATAAEIGPLLDKFLDQKSLSEGATLRTRGNLEQRVKAWIEREKIRTLADITREACLALRDRQGPSAATRKNDMNAVSSFLSWLAQEQHLPFNPLRGQRRPKVVRSVPTIYSTEEAKRILDAAARYQEGKFARFVGLLFLAGLRPSEVPASVLDLAHRAPAVRVQGGKLRGRANRIVHLERGAAAWLKKQPAQIVEPTTGQRRQICKIAGVEWKQDGARHTWISARLTLTNDEKLVAREAGTSPDIIFAHYHRLMPRADAKAFAGLGGSSAKQLKKS